MIGLVLAEIGSAGTIVSILVLFDELVMVWCGAVAPFSTRSPPDLLEAACYSARSGVLQRYVRRLSSFCFTRNFTVKFFQNG